MSYQSGKLDEAVVRANVLAHYHNHKTDIMSKLEDFKSYLLDIQIKHSKDEENIKSQRGKDEMFMSSRNDFFKKNDQVVEEKKNDHHKFIVAAKSTLDTCKPSELASLPVKKFPELEDIFRFLFEILYPANNLSEYNWPHFCKIALKKQSNDFRARLACYTIDSATPDQIEKLKKIIDRGDMHKYNNGSLIDLLAWMDFLYEQHLKNQEIKEQKDVKEGFLKEANERKIRAGYVKSLLPHTTKLVQDIMSYSKQLEDIEKLAHRLNDKLDIKELSDLYEQCRELTENSS